MLNKRYSKLKLQLSTLKKLLNHLPLSLVAQLKQSSRTFMTHLVHSIPLQDNYCTSAEKLLL